MAVVAYAIALLALALFSGLAYWRGNPVIFQIIAGISMMTGLYSPDALKSLNYSTFGISIGLMLIFYAFVCIGFAYGNLFRKKEEEE